MGRSTGAQALPRAERLRQAAEIQQVFQRGSRIERRAFLALWRPVEGPRKIGFAVSRQVRSAVDRNRVRRRVREAYRRHRAAFPTDLAVVFIGRPGARTAPFDELLEDMIGTAGILKQRNAAPRRGPGEEARA
jgi:ribonuclease P protein component